MYSTYGAIYSLNTNIKNLKALEEAGVIKLPNIGIHYDNLRNTIIRECTKAGNSVYAANIPIISNGLGRFLGATNSYRFRRIREDIKVMGASGWMFRKGEYVTEKDLDIIIDIFTEMVFYSSNKLNISSGERVHTTVSFSQIEKYLDINNPEYINVGDKKVILYIDSGLEGASVEELEVIEKSRELGAIIVTDLEELGRILR